jgi:hypothetical protein
MVNVIVMQVILVNFVKDILIAHQIVLIYYKEFANRVEDVNVLMIFMVWYVLDLNLFKGM